MSHSKHSVKRVSPISNEGTKRKRSQKKYQLPVIGHFKDQSIVFSSILEAERVTKTHYSLIFEACIGKIFRAGGAYWEFKKGTHFIKYKAFYINAQTNYMRKVGWNG
jgi:hypothetical protein